MIKKLKSMKLEKFEKLCRKYNCDFTAMLDNEFGGETGVVLYINTWDEEMQAFESNDIIGYIEYENEDEECEDDCD